MKKITFIGLGIMGSRMAANILKTGADLTVYNRTQEKAQTLVQNGAKLASSLEIAVKDADIVFTMLSKPSVVHALAKDFLKSMKHRALWVDCSTVSPQNSLNSKAMASKAGIRFLEAPVAGTKQPAENGELVFFMGGDQQDQEEIDDYTAAMGKNAIDMGVVGNAAKIKLLVNLMLAQAMASFSETVKFGTAMGLPQALIHNILLATPVTAPFLQNVRGKLESQDTSPNFPLALMTKDLSLVRETAESLAIQLPLADTLTNLFDQAVQEKGEEDFSSIYHVMNN